MAKKRIREKIILFLFVKKKCKTCIERPNFLLKQKGHRVKKIESKLFSNLVFRHQSNKNGRFFFNIFQYFLFN